MPVQQIDPHQVMARFECPIHHEAAEIPLGLLDYSVYPAYDDHEISATFLCPCCDFRHEIELRRC